MSNNNKNNKEKSDFYSKYKNRESSYDFFKKSNQIDSKNKKKEYNSNNN